MISINVLKIPTEGTGSVPPPWNIQPMLKGRVSIINLAEKGALAHCLQPQPMPTFNARPSATPKMPAISDRMQHLTTFNARPPAAPYRLQHQAACNSINP